jgi:hypothetical protein
LPEPEERSAAEKMSRDFYPATHFFFECTPNRLSRLQRHLIWNFFAAHPKQ